MTVKVIELVGNSEESWEDAAQQAVADANETLEEITGIDVVSQTADVEDGLLPTTGPQYTLPSPSSANGDKKRSCN